MKYYNYNANGHITRYYPQLRPAKVLTAEAPPNDNGRIEELNSNNKIEN